MKTIVISAVSLRKGGTLAVLRNCLQYLSSLSDKYRIVALVHNKDLAFYPGIEYIEIPRALRSWPRRIWCEYVTMKKISAQLSPVYLWFSLHDVTPTVTANRRAVYLQTSFPFFRLKFRDFFFDYKIPVFALLAKLVYRINIHRNKYIVVQQEWLRENFSRTLLVDKNKFIVAPPDRSAVTVTGANPIKKCDNFIFVSTPDCHKNFELLCAAAEMLENEIGAAQFKVTLTIDGTENRYSHWVYRKWKHVHSIEYAGFMNSEKLHQYYEKSDCLIFPSRTETWGLPISEFMKYGKPMLLADLPYAHETAAGSELTAFFDPGEPDGLKEKMKKLLAGDRSFLGKVADVKIVGRVANSWQKLFEVLLEE